MVCGKERTKLNNALGRLQELWDRLKTASPSQKPALVKKIEAQNAIVDRAQAELEICIRKNNAPPSQTDATFAIIFRSDRSWGFFNEFDVSRTFRFSGPAADRRFELDDIVVKRDAVVTMSAIRGRLNKSTGWMELQASIGMTFLATTYREGVTLNSGKTTSPTKLFHGVGQALSKTDHSFKLVGSALLSNGVEHLEFVMSVEGAFSAPP